MSLYNIAISELLETAKNAAKTGAEYAARERGRNREANSFDRHDVKLKLDVETQQKVTEVILTKFPEHYILGEEDAECSTTPVEGYEWIIDPIDGTVNFFHGNPYWCTSVAVRLNGTTLAACVCAPDIEMLFEASIETPALRNNTPIHVSDTDSLDFAIVHTGADKNENSNTAPFRFINAIGAVVQRPRIYGAAALDVCLTAAGMADGYFEPGIFIWDIAAADLIVRQAGGAGTILHDFGGNHIAYLASNGIIHKQLSDIITPLIIDY